MWHSKRNAQEQKRAIGVFKQFYEVIKPGRILLVDAMDVDIARAEINKISGSISNNKYRVYAEISTMQKIEKAI